MVLGLVAMATTVDNLYASMKALVCIVGNNQLALKEMEISIFECLVLSKLCCIFCQDLDMYYNLGTGILHVEW